MIVYQWCIKLTQTWLTEISNYTWRMGCFQRLFQELLLLLLLLLCLKPQHFHQCSGSKSNFTSTAMPDWYKAWKSSKEWWRQDSLVQQQSGLLGNPFQNRVFLQSKVKNDTRNKGHRKVGRLWKVASLKEFRLMSYSSWTQVLHSVMLQKGSANRGLIKGKNWKTTVNYNHYPYSEMWKWCRNCHKENPSIENKSKMRF